MRVAALYDVHGNLPALDAVLADDRLDGADVIVCGGDLVAGPMPDDCLDRLEGLGDRVRFLSGNGDRETVGGGGGAAPASLTAYAAGRLGAERLARVAAWPATVRLDVEGLGRVLFCHATPLSDTPILTAVMPEADVLRELGSPDADVVVCGHVHVRYDRTLATGLRLVNAGSVGAPYEGSAGAYWALLGPGVELCRTEYDVEAAAAAIAATGCPEIEWLTVSAMLEPVTADEATAEFERRRGA